MNWEQAIEEVESIEFDAQVNVASSTRGFFKAAARHSAVAQLLSCLSESGESAEELLGRIYQFSQFAVDPRYRHPKDTALAIFLWVMVSDKPEYGQLAAQFVDFAPNCWHAKKMARDVLYPDPLPSGNEWYGETEPIWKSSGTSQDDQILVLDQRSALSQARFLPGSSVASSTDSVPADIKVYV
jgi:hypothetical protein